MMAKNAKENLSDIVDKKHAPSQPQVSKNFCMILSDQFVFVFREKGPGTCTRARELLLLVTCTMDVLILLMCLALPSKLASLLWHINKLTKSESPPFVF